MSAGNEGPLFRARPIVPPYPAHCIERTIRRLADQAEACGALAVKHENLAATHEAARLALTGVRSRHVLFVRASRLIRRPLATPAEPNDPVCI
jgi:hypothetical protein